jgi:hypothetical protein
MQVGWRRKAVSCSICSQDAMGICRHCGAALCEEHFSEAQAYTIGGTSAYGCPHRAGTRKVTSRAIRDKRAGPRA